MFWSRWPSDVLVGALSAAVTSGSPLGLLELSPTLRLLAVSSGGPEAFTGGRGVCRRGRRHLGEHPGWGCVHRPSHRRSCALRLSGLTRTARLCEKRIELGMELARVGRHLLIKLRDLQPGAGRGGSVTRGVGSVGAQGWPREARMWRPHLQVHPSLSLGERLEPRGGGAHHLCLPPILADDLRRRASPRDASRDGEDALARRLHHSPSAPPPLAHPHPRSPSPPSSTPPRHRPPRALTSSPWSIINSAILALSTSCGRSPRFSAIHSGGMA